MNRPQGAGVPRQRTRSPQQRARAEPGQVTGQPPAAPRPCPCPNRRGPCGTLGSSSPSSLLPKWRGAAAGQAQPRGRRPRHILLLAPRPPPGADGAGSPATAPRRGAPAAVPLPRRGVAQLSPARRGEAAQHGGSPSRPAATATAQPRLRRGGTGGGAGGAGASSGVWGAGDGIGGLQGCGGVPGLLLQTEKKYRLCGAVL